MLEAEQCREGTAARECDGKARSASEHPEAVVKSEQ